VGRELYKEYNENDSKLEIEHLMADAIRRGIVYFPVDTFYLIYTEETGEDRYDPTLEQAFNKNVIRKGR